ncbi:PLD nuclease N-terminal domain-containing protein [Frankia sp. CcWB3]
MLGLALTFVIIGVWAYAIIDVFGTPPEEVRIMPKLAWIVAVIFLGIFGTAGWFFFGRPRANSAGERPLRRPVSDHPAFGQRSSWGVDSRRDGGFNRYSARTGTRRAAVRPKGPDDDPDFMRELSARIRKGEAGPPPSSSHG